MTTADHIPDTPHAKASKRMLEHAKRMRLYRRDLRAKGQPEARHVDQAISEAASFLIRFATSAPVQIDLAQLHAVATIILIRMGYDRKLARREISDRLRPRSRHISSVVMPSIAPTNDVALLEPPRGGGAWLEADLEILRKIVAPATARSHTV